MLDEWATCGSLIDIYRCYGDPDLTTKKIARGGFAAVPDPAFAEGSTARLVTGHSLQWLKAQPSKSVSIFFFSPPYNKRRPGGDKCGGALWNAQLAEGYASFGDDLTHAAYVEWMHDLLTECWRVLKDDGAIFFQHKDQPFKGRLLTPEELIPADVLDHLRQRIIWHRQAAYTPNKNFLNPSFEFIHLLAKPKFKFATAGKLFDVLSIRPTAKIDPNHPAPMPVELPRRIFEHLKPEHDIICDVFSGSGTTGVAARATGRHYIGIELDAGYNAKAAERLNCTVETLAPPVPVKRQAVKATLFNADCLKAMTKLADESVDLIAVDLPYGVSVEAWDKIVPMDKMFAEFRRILSPTGNIVMTAQGRFSAALIAAALDLYCYSMVWAKTRKTQHLHKDYRVLAEHEDVLVFAKGGMGNNAKVHPTYNPQGLVELDKPGGVRVRDEGIVAVDLGGGQGLGSPIRRRVEDVLAARCRMGLLECELGQGRHASKVVLDGVLRDAQLHKLRDLILGGLALGVFVVLGEGLESGRDRVRLGLGRSLRLGGFDSQIVRLVRLVCGLVLGLGRPKLGFQFRIRFRHVIDADRARFRIPEFLRDVGGTLRLGRGLRRRQGVFVGRGVCALWKGRRRKLGIVRCGRGGLCDRAFEAH